MENVIKALKKIGVELDGLPQNLSDSYTSLQERADKYDAQVDTVNENPDASKDEINALSAEQAEIEQAQFDFILEVKDWKKQADADAKEAARIEKEAADAKAAEEKEAADAAAKTAAETDAENARIAAEASAAEEKAKAEADAAAAQGKAEGEEKKSSGLLGFLGFAALSILTLGAISRFNK